MENMGSVFVYMDPLHILTVDVAANMAALFHHQAALSLLKGQIRPDSGKQTASNQYVIIFFHVRFILSLYKAHILLLTGRFFFFRLMGLSYKDNN